MPPGPPTPLSPRVQLEVELLTSGFAVPPVATDAHPADERERRHVLLVARDPDLRRYLRECLEGEGGLHLLEADSLVAALDVARSHVLHLVIVDATQQGITARLADAPAIVVADVAASPPAGSAPPIAPRVALPLPFGAQALRELTRQLIG